MHIHIQALGLHSHAEEGESPVTETTQIQVVVALGMYSLTSRVKQTRCSHTCASASQNIDYCLQTVALYFPSMNCSTILTPFWGFLESSSKFIFSSYAVSFPSGWKRGTQKNKRKNEGINKIIRQTLWTRENHDEFIPMHGRFWGSKVVLASTFHDFH